MNVFARRLRRTALGGIAAGGLIFANSINAATLWTGPRLSFTEPPGANPVLPQNQDRLTSNVWITRDATGGIYNAKTETSFTHFFSPANTQWADGIIADYALLNYTDWDSWAKGIHGGPPFTLGINVVAHLISDDIYLEVMFDSWGGAAGGFSWTRSTPSTSTPPLLSSIFGVALANGSLHFSVTNIPNLTLSVVATTNLAAPRSNWTVLGTMTESPQGSGVYQFTDGSPAGSPGRFYQVRIP